MSESVKDGNITGEGLALAANFGVHSVTCEIEKAIRQKVELGEELTDTERQIQSICKEQKDWAWQVVMDIRSKSQLA
jgi:glucose-6-phosphate-specific signal transduction histidine kinase